MSISLWGRHSQLSRSRLGQATLKFTLKFGTKRKSTDLMSNSARVTASRTTSLMHGGGVMGRLSCRLPMMSQPSHGTFRVLFHGLPCLRNRTFELGWVVGSHLDYSHSQLSQSSLSLPKTHLYILPPSIETVDFGSCGDLGMLGSGIVVEDADQG